MAGKHKGVSVKTRWRDGLPVDRAEEALRLKIEVESGVTSWLSALTQLLGSESAAMEEIERILSEEDQDVSRVLVLAEEGVDLQEEDEEGESASSKRAVAQARQQVGWRDDEAGRQKKGPKLGG